MEDDYGVFGMEYGALEVDYGLLAMDYGVWEEGYCLLDIKVAGFEKRGDTERHLLGWADYCSQRVGEKRGLHAEAQRRRMENGLGIMKFGGLEPTEK